MLDFKIIRIEETGMKWHRTNYSVNKFMYLAMKMKGSFALSQ